MCADACESAGLEVRPLSDATRARLGSMLPAAASTVNPVDMIASATAEHYGNVLAALASSGEVDALIAIFVRPLGTRGAEVQRAIEAAAASHAELPFLSVLMSDADAAGAEGAVPIFPFAEEAARALAHAARYRAWRDRPPGAVPELADADRTRAAAVVGAAAAAGSHWLSAAEVDEVLDCYGLPRLRSREAQTPDAVAAIAAELGGRVAVKAIAPGLIHKTDAGGVRVDLRGPDEARAAAKAIAAAVAAHGHPRTGFLVQPMAEPGIEMLVGMVVQENFGPIVACGAGGAESEIRRDVAVGLAPVTDLQAERMVRSLASYPLLEAHRGAPAADVAALEDVVVRVAAMADAHPEIAELDCNPVIVASGGAVIVDARIRVAPPRPVVPWPALPRPAVGQPGPAPTRILATRPRSGDRAGSECGRCRDAAWPRRDANARCRRSSTTAAPKFTRSSGSSTSSPVWRCSIWSLLAADSGGDDRAALPHRLGHSQPETLGPALLDHDVGDVLQRVDHRGVSLESASGRRADGRGGAARSRARCQRARTRRNTRRSRGRPPRHPPRDRRAADAPWYGRDRFGKGVENAGRVLEPVPPAQGEHDRVDPRRGGAPR